MSILNNSLLLGADAGAGGYQVARSIRLNSADSAHLSRTPASAGNRKTWTWAGWVKRSKLGSGSQSLFTGYWANTDNGYFNVVFLAGDTLAIQTWSIDARITTQVFRDASAWYHIVVAVDTTQASNVDRIKLYVNGSQVTSFSSTGTIAQNTDLAVNYNGAHYIGSLTASTSLFNGYLADIHLIDGQALTPSSFAETNATTGQWVPKAYTGSYGTNGFQLKFADNSNNTAATLGKDTSGNGNNWTPNNLSVTAGAGNDSLVDTPTSYGTDTGAGGQVRGNYCTLNALTSSAGFTLSNGSLDITDNGANAPVVLGTIAVNSGKWYWEVTLGNQFAYVGAAQVTSRSSVAYLGATTDQFVYNVNDKASSWANGVLYNYSTASNATTGDVIGVTLDFDSNTITFYKNGTSQGAFSSSVLGTSTWAPAFKSNVSSSAVFNFGQRPFAYTAPSGFKALCDTNLPAPVVAKPNTAFDVKLYTGNSSTQTISGLGFSPDFVWIKPRSAAYDHIAYDTVRGTLKPLFPNLTNAENPGFNNSLTAFNSDGYTLGFEAQINQSGVTFASWCWDAGSSTVTNTQGSITSQVRANASAGFSIVTYTGNGSSSQSVGHGLGVAPGMFIIKTRSTAEDWIVWHKSVTGSPPPYAKLNTTQAFGSSSDQLPSVPTSTVIYLGNSTGGATNTSGRTYVAYCFAPVAGYSSFGSYTGNGSSDGPFVFCNFRPAFVLVKGTSTGYIWTIEDSKRDTYNGTSKYLQPQSSAAEGSVSAPHYDFTSNGFKIRTTDSAWNQNGITYIWAAFAESPFQYARAR